MSVKMVYTAHSHGEGAQHSKHVRRHKIPSTSVASPFMRLSPSVCVCLCRRARVLDVCVRERGGGRGVWGGGAKALVTQAAQGPRHKRHVACCAHCCVLRPLT